MSNVCVCHWYENQKCLSCRYKETKEEAKMKNTDELKQAQESANFGYQSVQGIIEAHKDKENPSEVPPFKKVPLTFSDFDKSVKRTWKDQDFKDAVSNASLGLTGEAGEVADLVKKAIYHGRGFKNRYSDVPVTGISHNNNKAIECVDVKDELSDILFYVSAMAQEFGFTLEEVARHNKEKLEKRYEKGFTVEESAQKKDKHEVDIWRYYDKDGNLLDTLQFPDSKLREESYRVTCGTRIVKDRGGN